MLTFSTAPDPSPFLPPKNLKVDALEGFSLGPESINTPPFENKYSEVWGCEYVAGDFMLQHESDTPTLEFSDADVVHVDVTFDQVGGPLYLYQKNDGDVYLRWFDPEIPAITITNLGPGLEPSITIDTVYRVSTSDIIVSYRVGNQVRYRLGSDRYTIEYVVPALSVTIFHGGHMGLNNRVIFQGE